MIVKKYLGLFVGNTTDRIIELTKDRTISVPDMVSFEYL